MRGALAACAAIPLIAAAPLAQSRSPDLSGRWQLAEPTASERASDTLVITSPDQLLITDSPLEKIVIAHPSKPGTHPETGSFTYGEGGRIGGLPGGGSSDEKWGVTHIGTQLMMSRSTTHRAVPGGAPITVAQGSIWRLEAPDRLAIEFSEERTGERPKVATRTYVRTPTFASQESPDAPAGKPIAPRIAPRAAVP